jgi:hypothetical protein
VLTTLPPSVSRLSRQCGIHNVLQPYRPPRSVTGIALLYLLSMKQNIPPKYIYFFLFLQTVIYRRVYNKFKRPRKVTFTATTLQCYTFPQNISTFVQMTNFQIVIELKSKPVELAEKWNHKSVINVLPEHQIKNFFASYEEKDDSRLL